MPVILKQNAQIRNSKPYKIPNKLEFKVNLAQKNHFDTFAKFFWSFVLGNAIGGTLKKEPTKLLIPMK